MSSSGPVSNSAATESKSAKKRKAKPTTASASSATNGTSSPTVEAPQENTEATTNGADYESPYTKELQKNLRNAAKKLSATAKAQSIVDENPGVSIDDLVAAKKLNNDQKAQLDRKPALQQQIKSIEDQLDRYRQFGKEHEERFEREKTTIKQTHEAEVSKAKQAAAEEASAKYSAQQAADLLILTQFLHAASSKRNDETTPALEGKAFEGVLLKIYQGSHEAVEEMKKLMTGADSKVVSIEGEDLEFTYAQVKQLSYEAAPKDNGEHEEQTKVEEPEQTSAPAYESPAANTIATGTVSDPTIINAGMTELEDTVTIPAKVNGFAEAANEDTVSAIPEQASIGADAGNAVAESSWDPTPAVSDSWVEVPRNPTETETGLTATTAAPAEGNQSANSWAEEAHEAATAQAKVDAENDGFETVQHHHPRERGRGRGRGEFRGRGRGEGHRGGRGRGERGEGGERRGSGRGRGRGDGQFRGPREGRARDGQRGGARPAE